MLSRFTCKLLVFDHPWDRRLRSLGIHSGDAGTGKRSKNWIRRKKSKQPTPSLSAPPPPGWCPPPRCSPGCSSPRSCASGRLLVWCPQCPRVQHLKLVVPRVPSVLTSDLWIGKYRSCHELAVEGSLHDLPKELFPEHLLSKLHQLETMLFRWNADQFKCKILNTRGYFLSSSHRAFYSTKMCEKSKSTTFLYYENKFNYNFKWNSYPILWSWDTVSERNS